MSCRLLAELLHAPRDVARRCLTPNGARALATSALAAIWIGGVAFGAAVGSHRGGSQIALTALKLPIVTVVTLSVCCPAFYVLAGALGRSWPLRSVLGLALAAGARSSLVLFALAPLLWLAIDLGASYHAVKLLAASAYGLAGASALALVVRAIEAGPGRSVLIGSMIGVFAVVGAQTAWVFRPYIGDPRDEQVPLFVRRLEGGLSGTLLGSAGRVFGKGNHERQ